MVDPSLDFRIGRWKDGLWVVFSQAFLVQQMVYGTDLDRRHAALGGFGIAEMVLRKDVVVQVYGGSLAVAGDGGYAATVAIDDGGKARVGVVSFWALELVLAWPFC